MCGALIDALFLLFIVSMTFFFYSFQFKSNQKYILYIYIYINIYQGSYRYIIFISYLLFRWILFFFAASFANAATFPAEEEKEKCRQV